MLEFRKFLSTLAKAVENFSNTFHSDQPGLDWGILQGFDPAQKP